MSDHVYYKIRFTLLSPMNISSGENRSTDADVLLNSRGEPFIPATSIAGLLRELAGEQGDRLFGNASDEKDLGVSSPVLVYDATLQSSFSMNRRDHVKLTEYHVAEPGLKFDEECVEPGVVFVGYLETDKNAEQGIQAELLRVLGRLARRKCGFGRKSTRGFGQAEVKVWKKAFNLDHPEERAAWLDFSPFDPAAFTEKDVVELPEETGLETLIELDLRLTGGISIRVYSTEISPDGEEPASDYTYLRSGGKPAIPGSSWAGAFRHRYQEISQDLGLDKKQEDELFGHISPDGKDNLRSNLIFHETTLEGGRAAILTRNAIDRFSGRAKDQALYTEETYQGGRGTLRMTLTRRAPSNAIPVLGACICDLVNGLISVGGLTGVGRGQFVTEAVRINGEPVDLQEEGWENRLIERLCSIGEGM